MVSIQLIAYLRNRGPLGTAIPKEAVQVVKSLFRFETFDVVVIIVNLLETIWIEFKDCKPTMAEEKA